CARYGVFSWFVPTEFDGQQWSESDITRGYLSLSAACLTTTFVITQLTGASRRIAASSNPSLMRSVLPLLARGDQFATVGISHLTTSRRHLAKPVLRAEPTTGGFVLDGFSPWVTGATHAAHIVTGATMDDGRQVLVLVETAADGVVVEPPARLVGLSASHTGQVTLNRVLIPVDHVLDGPIENVMQQGAGARTGGLQTSTLAVGLATAAVDYMQREAERRSDLSPPADQLKSDLQTLREELLAAAAGQDQCDAGEIRRRANSLVLRSTQAALASAKGAGYLAGHPAGRWCCEALFFLVWSCPQPVMNANLCELAGISI
ncbi:MAG: acyl-CoA/acyl-ACP dehydrogenase, partial [Planctomycetales bacterium]|nr:acyl-CoA/acyl-ACP dehydrogenase [Planctomycetales bacterium]